MTGGTDSRTLYRAIDMTTQAVQGGVLGMGKRVETAPGRWPQNPLHLDRALASLVVSDEHAQDRPAGYAFLIAQYNLLVLPNWQVDCSHKPTE